MADIIYINDTAIDTDSRTRIAWTIQRGDVGDFSRKPTSFSNQIKIPKTEKNVRTFGFINSDKSADAFPYRQQSCKVVQNGVETIRNAVAYIRDAGPEFTLVIYDGFESVISTLSGKTLKNIDFGSAAWDAAGIDAARLNTSEFIAAAMNWGHSTSILYNVDRFLPCYFYYSLINKIFALTPYTLSGSILSSTDYTDLVCTPVKNFVYPESIASNNARISDSSVGASFLIGTDDIFLDGPIPITVVEYGLGNTVESSIYGNPSKDYKANDIFNATIELQANISSIAFDPGAAVRLRIVKNETTVLQTSGNITTNGVQTITVTTDLTTGDVVRGLFYGTGAPGDSVSATLTTVSLTVTATTTVARSAPKWTSLMNETSLSEIVKDFFVRFGLVYNVDGGVINLRTLESICTDNANAVDWSSKRVRSDGDVINFQTNYGQTNLFLAKDEVNEPTLGRGLFTVDNNTLQAERTIYTSPFANAKKWAGSGYNVMAIPAYDSTSASIGDIKNDVPFTIGVLKSRTTEASISFNGIARTDYKLAYFFDPTASKDAGWQYFVNRYYPTLALALQRNKVVTYTYLLNDQDIANYDPFKMVYDNGSYYLVNKISNYISGKPVRVEMFKIQ